MITVQTFDVLLLQIYEIDKESNIYFKVKLNKYQIVFKIKNNTY
ncbi:hypothetical protein NIES2109_08610 [Nostoc sp. HK-01]|nr:hypothetical protein NIES2109_08610 [Nostoc sp. HK-01]